MHGGGWLTALSSGAAGASTSALAALRGSVAIELIGLAVAVLPPFILGVVNSRWLVAARHGKTALQLVDRVAGRNRRVSPEHLSAIAAIVAAGESSLLVEPAPGAPGPNNPSR